MDSPIDVTAFLWTVARKLENMEASVKRDYANAAQALIGQQQRKEKTRSKGPSESGREKGAPRSRQDPNASSGAEGDVSSEREP